MQLAQAKNKVVISDAGGGDISFFRVYDRFLRCHLFVPRR